MYKKFTKPPQTEMMTRAELAFSALDTDKTGYITLKQLKKLSKKLSDKEVKTLMVRVRLDVSNQTASNLSFLVGHRRGWKVEF